MINVFYFVEYSKYIFKMISEIWRPGLKFLCHQKLCLQGHFIIINYIQWFSVFIKIVLSNTNHENSSK